MNTNEEWVRLMFLVCCGIIMAGMIFMGCATPPPAMCDALVQRVEKAHTQEDAQWAMKQYDRYHCNR